MSVRIDVVYDGELHTMVTHAPSGRAFTTDAPTDNGGQGEAISPTDLMAAALGSCVLTVMGLVAQRNGLDIAGATASVVKEMATHPVRRVGSLSVVVRVPAEKAAQLLATDRARLEAAAMHCPVHHSLHPEVRVDIRIEYA